MNGPERLRLGNDRFVAELLASARDLDAPSPDAAGRIALAIVHRGHLRLGRRRGLWGMLGGLGVLGLVTTSLLVGGHRYPSPVAPLVASTFAIRDVELPTVAASEAAHPVPCAASTSTSSVPLTPKPPLSRVIAPPPKDEIALIDRARAAVRAGDSRGALGALAQHAAEFPKPRFGEEAAALRVEALVLTGDGAAAEREARRFLGAYPRSAYARRVRSAAAIDE